MAKPAEWIGLQPGFTSERASVLAGACAASALKAYWKSSMSEA